MWIEFKVVDYPCYEGERHNKGIVNTDKIETILLEQTDVEWHVCIRLTNGDLAFMYVFDNPAISVYEGFKRALHSKPSLIDLLGSIELIG